MATRSRARRLRDALRPQLGAGLRCEGEVAAVEDGVAWAVSYALSLDSEWRTRSAHVACLTPTGRAASLLEADGHGKWRVDGEPAARLDGCADVDLEASVLTNAVSVRRLRLTVGETADARPRTSALQNSGSSGSSSAIKGSPTTGRTRAATTGRRRSGTPPSWHTTNPVSSSSTSVSP